MANDKTHTEAWWTSQLNKATEWKKKHGKVESWERIDKYYNLDVKNPTQPGFNLIYVMANAVIPALIYQNPSMMNTPRRPSARQWAQYFDGVDNVLLSEMKTKEVAEELILNAFLFNTVGLQIGYDFPIQEEMKTASSELFPSVDWGWDSTRKYNQPYWDVVDPRKLLVAVGTKNMRNCRWFAKEIVMPVRVLKEMRSRGYRDLRNLKPTHNSKAFQRPNREMEDTTEGFGGDYVMFHEIHDAETQQWMWLSANGKYILPPQDDPLQIDGLPLELLTFNQNPKSIWGTADSLYIESQYLEGNECRRDGRRQRKNALIKFFYRSDRFDEDQLDSFINGGAVTGIPMELEAEEKLGDILQVVQTNVQEQYYDYEDRLLNDAQLLCGIGPNQMGQFAKGRRSKYEASVVQERNLMKTGSRKARLGEVLSNQMARVNQLVQKNWDAEHLAPIIGKEGAIHWVLAKPTAFRDLKMQLQTTTNIESLVPPSTQEKRQELTEVLAVLGKFEQTPELHDMIMKVLSSFLASYNWDMLSKTLPTAGEEETMSQFQEGQQKQEGVPQQLEGVLNQVVGAQGMQGMNERSMQNVGNGAGETS